MQFCDWTEQDMGSDVQYLIDGFGDSGQPNELVQAFVSSTDALDGSGKEWWLVLTNQRWALIKPGGIFSGTKGIKGEHMDLEEIQVGDSHHHQQMGLTAKDFQLVTLTFLDFEGNEFQRHIDLGQNEEDRNANRKLVREFLDAAREFEIPVVPGPGWESSGGYSVGYGFFF
jgi:hypothetical protein